MLGLLFLYKIRNLNELFSLQVDRFLDGKTCCYSSAALCNERESGMCFVFSDANDVFVLTVLNFDVHQRDRPPVSLK